MSAQDQDRSRWVESLREKKQKEESSDWAPTFLLSLFLGMFGADRFYLGSVALGSLKALSFGGLGVWWIIDIVLLLTVGIKDADGGLVKMPSHDRGRTQGP